MTQTAPPDFLSRRRCFFLVFPPAGLYFNVLLQNSFASSSGPSGFSSPSSSSGRRMAAYVHYPSSSGRRIGFSGILVILEVSNYQTVWERKTIRMRRSRSKHGSAPCAATSMSVPSRRRIARSAASRGSISTQSNSRPASRRHAAGRGERRPNLREVPAGCEGKRLNLREMPAGWGWSADITCRCRAVVSRPGGVLPSRGSDWRRL